jgi:hypothetical protein
VPAVPTLCPSALNCRRSPPTRRRRQRRNSGRSWARSPAHQHRIERSCSRAAPARRSSRGSPLISTRRPQNHRSSGASQSFASTPIWPVACAAAPGAAVAFRLRPQSGAHRLSVGPTAKGSTGSNLPLRGRGREGLESAGLARCRASRRRSLNGTDSGRSVGAAGTGLNAPKPTF